MTKGDEGRASTTRAVRFSHAIFGLDEIKKAAYRFTDRCAFDFALEGEDVVCTIRIIATHGKDDFQELEDAFRNEVLDQDLRRRIGEETAPVRNAILAYAFSKTGIQE